MTRKGALLSRFLLTIWLLFSFCSLTSAQVQPLYIDDNANVLSKEMATKLTQLLIDTEKEQKFHVEIVILPNFYGKPVDSVVNAYYQQMIKNTPPGVSRSALLLVGLDNEYIRLVTTPNIVGIFNAKVTQDITGNVAKQLHDKNFDEMARIGAAGILHYYQEKFPAFRNKSPFKNLMNILFFFVMIGVVVYLIKRRSEPKVG